MNKVLFLAINLLSVISIACMELEVQRDFSISSFNPEAQQALTDFRNERGFNAAQIPADFNSKDWGELFYYSPATLCGVTTERNICHYNTTQKKWTCLGKTFYFLFSEDIDNNINDYPYHSVKNILRRASSTALSYNPHSKGVIEILNSGNTQVYRYNPITNKLVRHRWDNFGYHGHYAKLAAIDNVFRYSALLRQVENESHLKTYIKIMPTDKRNYHAWPQDFMKGDFCPSYMIEEMLGRYTLSKESVESCKTAWQHLHFAPDDSYLQVTAIHPDSAIDLFRITDKGVKMKASTQKGDFFKLLALYRLDLPSDTHNEIKENMKALYLEKSFVEFK